MVDDDTISSTEALILDSWFQCRARLYWPVLDWPQVCRNVCLQRVSCVGDRNIVSNSVSWQLHSAILPLDLDTYRPQQPSMSSSVLSSCEETLWNMLSALWSKFAISPKASNANNNIMFHSLQFSLNIMATLQPRLKSNITHWTTNKERESNVGPIHE